MRRLVCPSHDGGKAYNYGTTLPDLYPHREIDSLGPCLGLLI